MDMVLAKTDLAIASRYAQLVPDETLREHIFARIVTEWQYTTQALDEITGAMGRLSSNPSRARSKTVFHTLIRSTTCRSSCSAATAPAILTSVCGAVST